MNAKNLKKWVPAGYSMRMWQIKPVKLLDKIRKTFGQNISNFKK